MVRDEELAHRRQRFVAQKMRRVKTCLPKSLVEQVAEDEDDAERYSVADDLSSRAHLAKHKWAALYPQTLGGGTLVGADRNENDR